MILGSHACRAGMLMLEHKGIPYRTVNLPAGLHPFAVRLLGFPAAADPREAGDRKPWSLALADRIGTVPALRLGKERVQSNRRISRFLDRVRPEPPLFPSDPERRAAVEEAERWGDDILQMAARRLAICAALHRREWPHDRGNDGRLGPVLWHNETVRYIGLRILGRTTFRAGAATEAELLATVARALDRVDSWIAEGALNGPELNAADLMIAPSVALLTYRPDLRPEIERRPVAALIDRLLPEPASAP